MTAAEATLKELLAAIMQMHPDLVPVIPAPVGPDHGQDQSNSGFIADKVQEPSAANNLRKRRQSSHHHQNHTPKSAGYRSTRGRACKQGLCDDKI
jgi:hypothetical protein